jgi:HemY protein
MLRALWLFAVVAVVTLGALWVAGIPGVVTVELPSATYQVSVAASLVLLALLIAASIFVFRVFAWLGLVPEKLALWGASRRRRKGMQALTRGLVATAAGDVDDAKRHTKKALSLVGEPPLALLLAAQNAQLAGDEAGAERYFTAMLANSEMEFLGLRGLYMAAMRKGDETRALELARRAFVLRPKAQWVVSALFDLQTGKRDWAHAGETLEAIGKAKLLDTGVTRRRRAVLRAAQAQEAEENGDAAKALALAQEAIGIAPGLTAAALIAARLSAANGRLWKASAILEQAWAKEPHPALARSYADLKPDETAKNRAIRLNGLAVQKPDHPESRILSASVALASGDWQRAKEAIRDLALNAPSARICTLMADIERQAGDETESRGWSARAIKAPRDAVWACASCARQYTDWTAACPGCHAFDTLAWLSGPADKVTKLPDGLTGAQADTGDMAAVLYREAIKRDPQAAPPRPPAPRPDPAEGSAAQPQIFRPQAAPDDPGPGVREWDETETEDKKRGVVW